MNGKRLKRQRGAKRRDGKHASSKWAMHERAIAAAKRGLDVYMECEKVCANLADMARMLAIASKLRRLATGLGTDGERRKGDDLPAMRVQVTVAMEKIYGEPLPGEVVDVQEVPRARYQVEIRANSRWRLRARWNEDGANGQGH